MLEEEVPTKLKVLLTLSCTLTSLLKHIPPPAALVEGVLLRWFILSCEYCISISKIHAQTCYHMLPVAFGKRISKLENLSEILWNPPPISRFPSPKIIFSSPKIQFSFYEIRFTKIGFLLSSTAFRFLQQLSAFFNSFLTFFNGFPLSPTAFRISPMAFQFSSAAFRFPRNPRKSIYGEKYTKDCYSSFVFFATRSLSFVISAKQYLCLTHHPHHSYMHWPLLSEKPNFYAKVAP